MSDVGLRIKVSADVVDAIRALGGLNDNLVELATDGTTNIEGLSSALGDLRNAAKNAGNTQELGLFNRAIRDLGTEMKNLKQIGLKQTLDGDSQAIINLGRNAGIAGLTMGQSRVAFLDLGRAITGQGFTLRSLASNFSLLGPEVTIAVAGLYALYEVLGKTSDAEKKAEADAKKLAETLQNLKSAGEVTETATGAEAGNIARVKALAAVILDTNNAYKQRQQALNELKQTNKSYFGDLDLEASSLKLLADRVNAYSQALITEAIIKGQVEEISNLSRELQKQIPILKQYADAVDAQREARDKAVAASVGSNDFGAGGGGSSKVLEAENQLAALTKQYLKQNDAVATLKDQINKYTTTLDQNIEVQTKQKPLQLPTGSDNDLDKIKAIRREIAGIYTDLAKQDNRPNFIKFGDSVDGSPVLKAIDAEIDDIKKKFHDAQNDPALKSAYGDLITALSAKANKVKNVNLDVPINFTLADPSKNSETEIESKIEKAFGAKQIKIRVPVDITDAIKSEGFGKSETETLLKKSSEDALNGLPPIRWSPKIQLALDVAALKADFQKQLYNNINNIVKESATSGLSNIGKAIGDAISSGSNPIQAAGEAILGAIGGLIEQLGEAMIKYGAEVLLVKAILSSGLDLDPGVAIAAGIAMVAAGELIKKSFKGATKFGDGGIITGPTYSLMGEAGPEAVMPLDRIGEFLGGLSGQNSGGPVVMQSTIRGQDLLLVQQRAQKNLNITAQKTGI